MKTKSRGSDGHALDLNVNHTDVSKRVRTTNSLIHNFYPWL